MQIAISHSRYRYKAIEHLTTELKNDSDAVEIPRLYIRSRNLLRFINKRAATDGNHY